MSKIIFCFPISRVILNVGTVVAITVIGMAFRIRAGRAAGFVDILIPGLIVSGLGQIGIPDFWSHGLGSYRDIFGSYNGYGRDTYYYQILPPDHTFLEFNGQEDYGYDRDEET
jgi:hypothetical protein